jgi:trans-aconitate 2-methyltransferase
MLARARPRAGGGLRFALGEVAGFGEGGWDVVFSNAALQWLPDHRALLARLVGLLAAGGQLAVQVPANHDHPSHRLAAELAAEAPFAAALGGDRRAWPVRPPEWYAVVLDRLGLAGQHVRLQVYLHRLAGPEEVVEWVRGGLLTGYQRRLPAELFDLFLGRYRRRLFERLGDQRPYRYAFKRILLRAERP